MPAKKPAAPAKNTRSASTGRMVVNTVKVGSAYSTVTFGAVSVNAASPKAGEMRRNVTIGQAALARAVPRLVKPGVAVKTAGSVPLFRADPQDPSRLIREVDGRAASGKFVNGKFKVLRTKR